MLDPKKQGGFTPDKKGIDKMSQACKICNHPKRLEIDRELARGKGYQMIANTYGVNWQAVRRHAENHLSHQLRTAYEKKAALEGLDLLSEIEELISRTKRILDQAESENKLNTALNAIGQARGSYELLSRIAFSLHQARIAELELEREKSQETDQEQATEFAKQACDRLTTGELDLMEFLFAKINGETDELVEVGQYLPRMDDNDKEDLEPTFKRKKKSLR